MPSDQQTNGGAKGNANGSGKRLHEGKLAIVTGSARSIGAAIVRNLASKGCNVIINYATPESDGPAARLASELEAGHGVRAVPVRADISSAAGCDRIMAAAAEHFGSGGAAAAAAGGPPRRLRVDILVHNAAVLYLGPLEAVSEREFRHIYSVNVLGPALLTAACRDHLPTDRSGRIVIMSSVNPKIGLPGTGLYSGTKAALEALARVWCRELAERATVNCVNPGPVMTDMYLSAAEEVKQQLALWNPVTPLVPVRETDSAEVRELGGRLGGRAAYEHEIAGAVATICNPEFGWCTGNLIGVNGGLSFSV